MTFQDPIKGFQVKVRDPRLLCKEEFGEFLTPSTPGSAGVDLRACIDETIWLAPQECRLLDSGISIWINDPRYAALVLPRSGTGVKRGIVLGNGVGLVDSDYQGPMLLAATNRTNDPVHIDPMERIAQLIVVPVATPTWEIVENFDEETKRGVGGWGSTGTH